MVRINMFEDNEARTVRIEVSGHAAFGQSGNDIVCSAVSIITYTVAQVLLLLNEEGYLTKPPLIDLESGDGVLSATFKDGAGYGEGRRLMLYAATGYSLLRHNHPENVNVILSGGDPSI